MKRTRLHVLPPMRCDDGCGRCCGPVPVTARELGQIRAYLTEHHLTPRWHDGDPLRCPLYDGQRCTVYPVRPLLCRIFGHGKHSFLQCARGYNVNVKDDRVLLQAVRSNGPAVGLLGALLAEET